MTPERGAGSLGQLLIVLTLFTLCTSDQTCASAETSSATEPAPAGCGFDEPP